MKTYQIPEEANLAEAYEMCYDEIYSLIEVEEYDEDEDEDEDEILLSATKSTNITF